MDAQRHTYDQHSSLAGSVIGDFEIFEEIGRGGMGVVFRARQTSLDRIVALKVLSSSLGLTLAAVERFKREAQASGKLHHPNIVPIFAQGHEGDTYFYAMELVCGRSLHDIIDEQAHGLPAEDGGSSSGARRPMTPEELALADTEIIPREGEDSAAGSATDEATTDSATDTASSVCYPSAAAYYDTVARQLRDVAGALDYAHRHGVIHRDIKPHNLLVGDDGRLCISDFGLARVLEQPGVTVTGEFVGSPLYMSPEQISGDNRRVQQATDIYSLGATMYEWLTLRPPFPGTTREQVITRILTTDPIPPRSINRHVPVDLETICLKAMEKEPHKRYRAAEEMRDDLDRYLRRAPIRARRIGPIAWAGRYISRHKPVSISVAAAIIVVLLASLLFRQQRVTRQTEQFAATRDEEAVTAIARNLQLEQERTALFEQLENAQSNGAKFGEELKEWLQQQGPLGDVFQAGEQSAGQTEWTDAERIAAMFLTAVREVERKHFGGVDASSIEPHSAEALYLAALSEKDPATALAYIEQALIRRPDYREPRILRTWLYCQMSRLDDMLADAESIIAAAPDRPAGHLARAAANDLAGQYESALADAQTAAEAGGRSHRLDVLEGIALVGLGEADKAVGLFTRALRADSDCKLALLKRADAAVKQGRPYAAAIDLTRLLQLEPKNAEVYEMRGRCYEQLNQFEEARGDYFRAFQQKPSGRLTIALGRVTAALEERTRAAEQARAAAEQASSPAEHLPQIPTSLDSERIKELLEQLSGDENNG